MALRTFIAALSILMLMCASAAIAQAPPEEKTVHEQARREYRQNVLQYPLLKQHKIDQVFHLRVDDGQLAVEPALEPDREYQQKRAELEEIPEPAVILCWLISQDLGQVQFEVNLDDYSDPAAIGHLSLQARPNNTDTGKLLENLEIKMVWQTRTGMRTVFFTQAANSARLVIFANDGGPNGFVDINLWEKDFATLRRNHHAETERWLRPILRELRQEAAFAADPAAAWQVLADEWPIDEKVKPLVDGKLPALDDDDFRVRLRAANELQKLGRDAALVMMKMDRRPLSLEQNVRLDEVISRFEPLTHAEARRLSQDPSFLLDCLYGEDAIARKLALKRLQVISKMPIAFDLNAPDDARVIAVNALRDKLLGRETSKR